MLHLVKAILIVCNGHPLIGTDSHYLNFHVTAIGGSLFLFDRKVLRYFRKDGHNWRKKKDGKTVKEAHEKLKVSKYFYFLFLFKENKYLEGCTESLTVDAGIFCIIFGICYLLLCIL